MADFSECKMFLTLSDKTEHSALQLIKYVTDSYFNIMDVG